MASEHREDTQDSGTTRTVDIDDGTGFSAGQLRAISAVVHRMLDEALPAGHTPQEGSKPDDGQRTGEFGCMAQPGEGVERNSISATPQGIGEGGVADAQVVNSATPQGVGKGGVADAQVSHTSLPGPLPRCATSAGCYANGGSGAKAWPGLNEPRGPQSGQKPEARRREQPPCISNPMANCSVHQPQSHSHSGSQASTLSGSKRPPNPPNESGGEDMEPGICGNGRPPASPSLLTPS